MPLCTGAPDGAARDSEQRGGVLVVWGETENTTISGYLFRGEGRVEGWGKKGGPSLNITGSITDGNDRKAVM